MSDVIASTAHSLFDTENGIIGSLAPFTRYCLLFASPVIVWCSVIVLDNPFMFGFLWILLTLIGVGADRMNADIFNNNYVDSIPAAVGDDRSPENVEPDVGTQTEKSEGKNGGGLSSTHNDQLSNKLMDNIKESALSPVITHAKDDLKDAQDPVVINDAQQSIDILVDSITHMAKQMITGQGDEEEGKEEEVEEATEAETMWIFPTKMSRLNSDQNQTNSPLLMSPHSHQEIEIIEMDSTTDSGMMSIGENFRKFQDHKKDNESKF